MRTEKIKLFCLPYAGGSAQTIYNKWSDLLGPNIELYPIELAGRGARINERLYANIEEAIDDVLKKVKDEIVDSNYAFFGHSMGSILTYKVLQKIDDLQLRPPIHAFFSGRRAPHMPSRREKLFSKMNELEIENEILKLGGTPPEFFKYPELKNIFIPIIKSDFKIADTMIEKSEITSFNFDISILIGKDEDISISETTEWMRHTTKNFSVDYFDGGHFFLLDQQEAVINTITSKLVEQNVEMAV